MKSPLILAATALIALTLGIQAEARSTPAELRGYQACLDASAKDFKGVVTDRTFLVDRREGQRTYYINATAWQDGERANVSFRCETDLGGRLISTAEPANTRYVPAEAAVQVAHK